MSRLLFILSFLLLSPAPAGAQIPLFGGRLTGGFESGFALYTGDDGPSYGSNNYLKLDYLRGRLSAGLQMEWYPSPMLGYNPSLKGFGVPGKYVAWNATNWSLTLGDYYEQFGTGLVLRSWEDRALGWNNSIGGARLVLRTRDNALSAKILYGFPRKDLWYAPIQVAGASVSWQPGEFSIEAGVVDLIDGKTHGIGWSVAPAWAHNGFTVKAEASGRPGGNAQAVEMTFSARGFSSALTLRRLDHMYDAFGMNYLPALCQEQSYMLASLNPYTTFAAGEVGGVIDLFYRHKSWKFHVNGSMIYALPKALVHYDIYRMAYRDLNMDVEKRWNSRLKTILFVSIQENSPSHGDRLATDAQNVFVFDGVYRFGKAWSLRAQMQYLYSQELTRDWMAGLLELGIAPHWSVQVSDMYNHGDTREHYYSAGASFSAGSFKVALSYGHQRAGFVCSGGVCRWQPEYTGGLFRLNYSF